LRQKMNLLEHALKILVKYPLCDHCLGRQFAMLARGTTNELRGYSIKLLLTMKAHLHIKEGRREEGLKILKILASNGGFQPAENILNKYGCRNVHGKIKCYICGNIFEETEEIVDEIVKKLSEYEYSTFLVGSKIPGEIAEREDKLRSEYELNLGESFKSEFNRFLGKIVQKKTGREVSFKKPDIVVLVDLTRKKVEVESKPLYIYGRYRKLIRGIPQSTWICSSCGGLGCPECNYTGRKYPTSIEEIISKPVLELTMGESAVFHGAGREDVDARMLGRGRPFVIEVKKPKRRFIDLKLLEEKINENGKGTVEVQSLRFSSRMEVRKLKNLAPYTRKKYRLTVRVDGDLNEEMLKRLEEYFNGREIKQRTPLRVLHRRADKVRIKKVYSVKCRRISQSIFEVIIECQGGLYVKELVSGDEGRTKPSFSEILNMSATCLELDVLDVEGLVS